ncbi:hypothetical protein ACFL6T_02800 [Candidatus Zixiibacteriota bacterium]
MKKALRIIMAGLLVLPLFFSACTTDPDNPNVVIVGFFSWPMFYIHEGGTLNLGDYEQPITGGEPVDDATVTVTNTTTGESLVLTYFAPSEYMPVGYYGPGEGVEDFPHIAGEMVSVQIDALGSTFTGTPTVTSDAYSTITAPENLASVSQPFDLTWTIDQETTAATHVIVYVRNFSTNPYVMMSYILPITTTTLEITGLDPADNYYLSVFPVNRMPISGGHFAYVGTTSYMSNSLTVNIVPAGGN